MILPSSSHGGKSHLQCFEMPPLSDGKKFHFLLLSFWSKREFLLSDFVESHLLPQCFNTTMKGHIILIPFFLFLSDSLSCLSRNAFFGRLFDGFAPTGVDGLLLRDVFFHWSHPFRLFGLDGLGLFTRRCVCECECGCGCSRACAHVC